MLSHRFTLSYTKALKTCLLMFNIFNSYKTLTAIVMSSKVYLGYHIAYLCFSEMRDPVLFSILCFLSTYSNTVYPFDDLCLASLIYPDFVGINYLNKAFII